MEYLRAAIALKTLIRQANSLLLEKNKSSLNEKNIMLLSRDNGNVTDLKMSEFSNEFVLSTLNLYPGSEAFVITEWAKMDVKGKVLTYFLYKGYHKELDKGLVFFQPVNEETFEPAGELQFSNVEDNIFYEVSAPNFEESTNNAMETDSQLEGSKSIVFLVGNLDEERLIYDIQRLIFNTVNNVQKHPGIKFDFIVSIEKYNGKASEALKDKVKDIFNYTNEYVVPEYPNTSFKYEIEE